jgi:hypothetical protein
LTVRIAFFSGRAFPGQFWAEKLPLRDNSVRFWRFAGLRGPEVFSPRQGVSQGWHFGEDTSKIFKTNDFKYNDFNTLREFRKILKTNDFKSN